MPAKKAFHKDNTEIVKLLDDGKTRKLYLLHSLRAAKWKGKNGSKHDKVVLMLLKLPLLMPLRLYVFSCDG